MTSAEARHLERIHDRLMRAVHRAPSITELRSVCLQIASDIEVMAGGRAGADEREPDTVRAAPPDALGFSRGAPIVPGYVSPDFVEKLAQAGASVATLASARRRA